MAEIDERLTYEDMRRLIAMNQLVEPQAAIHAAMLSLLGKKEARGEPVPGWVSLEDEAKALHHA